MAKLRHISGDNLKALEGDLEKIKFPFVIQGITHAKGIWYIHFLIQGIHENVEIKEERITNEQATKTVTRKRKKK